MLGAATSAAEGAAWVGAATGDATEGAAALGWTAGATAPGVDVKVDCAVGAEETVGALIGLKGALHAASTIATPANAAARAANAMRVTELERGEPVLVR